MRCMELIYAKNYSLFIWNSNLTGCPFVCLLILTILFKRNSRAEGQWTKATNEGSQTWATLQVFIQDFTDSEEIPTIRTYRVDYSGKGTGTVREYQKRPRNCGKLQCSTKNSPIHASQRRAIIWTLVQQTFSQIQRSSNSREGKGSSQVRDTCVFPCIWVDVLSPSPNPPGETGSWNGRDRVRNERAGPASRLSHSQKQEKKKTGNEC